MWLLSSRAAFWLLLSVILVLNVPALSAPQARYIPPQAQVATPAAAAVKSETVYRNRPYGAGSRWKGQPDTEETAGYDTPEHDGSKKEHPFLDSPHSTLVRTPQYAEERKQQQQPRQPHTRRPPSHAEDDMPRYLNKRPAYDDSRDDSRYRPGSSRQYTDDAPAPEPPSSYYDDLETDDSRQYDEPEGRQYSRHRAYDKQPSYRQPDYQEPDPYSGSPAEEPRPAPYYGEQSRKEERIVDICLQRTSPQQFPGGAQPYEETFRCCKAADNADTCSKNTTDPSYPYAPQFKGQSRQDEQQFMDLVSSSPAATCRWAITDEAACPPFAFGGLGSTCVAVWLICTLSSAASECGCPIKEGSLYFSTVAYLRPLESLTCLRQPGDSNPRPYWATGAFLQGKLRSYATHEGGRSLVWKECSGSVEYSPVIPLVGGDSPQEADGDEYSEGDFWLRNGQMVVRLAEEHFAGRGAE